MTKGIKGYNSKRDKPDFEDIIITGTPALTKANKLVEFFRNLYLKAMLDRFGQIHLAVSAYNAGSGRVPTQTSMVGGMQYVNLTYMRNVLGMIQRFRLLFMGYKGAEVYLSYFPPQLWGFEVP